MKKEDLIKQNKILTICFFIVVFVFFLLIFFYINTHPAFEREGEIGKDVYPIGCNNLTLVDTSYCLRDYIEPFFKYNYTEDKIKLNFSELKERGGDCKDWSELYVSLGRNLGFYSSTTFFSINETSAHMIAIISNEEAYCVLDMIDFPKCGYFAEG